MGWPDYWTIVLQVLAAAVVLWLLFKIVWSTINTAREDRAMSNVLIDRLYEDDEDSDKELVFSSRKEGDD